MSVENKIDSVSGTNIPEIIPVPHPPIPRVDLQSFKTYEDCIAYFKGRVRSSDITIREYKVMHLYILQHFKGSVDPATMEKDMAYVELTYDTSTYELCLVYWKNIQLKNEISVRDKKYRLKKLDRYCSLNFPEKYKEYFHADFILRITRPPTKYPRIQDCTTYEDAKTTFIQTYQKAQEDSTANTYSALWRMKQEISKRWASRYTQDLDVYNTSTYHENQATNAANNINPPSSGIIAYITSQAPLQDHLRIHRRSSYMGMVSAFERLNAEDPPCIKLMNSLAFEAFYEYPEWYNPDDFNGIKWRATRLGSNLRLLKLYYNPHIMLKAMKSIIKIAKKNKAFKLSLFQYKTNSLLPKVLRMSLIEKPFNKKKYIPVEIPVASGTTKKIVKKQCKSVNNHTTIYQTYITMYSKFTGKEEKKVIIEEAKRNCPDLFNDADFIQHQDLLKKTRHLDKSLQTQLITLRNSLINN